MWLFHFSEQRIIEHQMHPIVAVIKCPVMMCDTIALSGQGMLISEPRAFSGIDRAAISVPTQILDRAFPVMSTLRYRISFASIPLLVVQVFDINHKYRP
jgi:hypothetical protein